MRVWIDGYEANVKDRLGSSVGAYELLRNIEKMDKNGDYTVVLPSAPFDDLPKKREGWRYKVLYPRHFWTFLALPFALFTASKKPDLVFSPTHYIPKLSLVKRIVTIFDLSFLHYPNSFTPKDLWQLKKGTDFSIKNADHIITISNSTKKDIIKNYDINEKKITVAYPGYDSFIYKPLISNESPDDVLKKYNIQQPFVLFVGTIQPRKNLIRLIDAVSKIDNLTLVVVGKHKGEGRAGWMFEDILNHPKKIGAEEKVKFTGFVPTTELLILLKQTICLVQPSLWEGFGIPVVEAMACGTPVVVSNTSSLPEVAGSAGLVVDPNSTDQIEQAIRVLLADKKLREKKAKLGIIQAKKFSWEKMASTVIKTFVEVSKE